ncbi:helix-turn-helix domain-containing protein [Candidatus Roseilinea sp. NK_OTU-006]|jgi:transcriptional regulator with XRE-family HTH domain|uniref:helix-turn-helix domain-containing protein n=1 Tax=Candidatus Roseilinea sp. NK_OTU-006 TaxID=2704250 RepID=UPI00145E7D09|nr:helix-turn-helix transcriptional regulator [Candidatus Roseilinea sp. NK_OTU-006]
MSRRPRDTATTIKTFRRRNKITQQELAIITDLSVRAVAGYERGDRCPDATALMKLLLFALEIEDQAAEYFRKKLRQKLCIPDDETITL